MTHVVDTYRELWSSAPGSSFPDQDQARQIDKSAADDDDTQSSLLEVEATTGATFLRTMSAATNPHQQQYCRLL